MRHSIAFVLFLLTTTRFVAGQSWTPPSDSQRCPSRWGAGDERGSANLMTRDQVLKAARLIRTGEVIELGQVLDPATMPFFPGRRWRVLPNGPTFWRRRIRALTTERRGTVGRGRTGLRSAAFTNQGTTMVSTTASSRIRSHRETGSQSWASSRSVP